MASTRLFPIVRTLLIGAALLAAACEQPASPTADIAAASRNANWPNEPAGLRVVTDWGLDQEPPTAGDVLIPGSPNWSVVYGVPPDPARGWAQRSSDPSAPLSPPNVYEFVYPQGMVEGTAPSTVYYPYNNRGLMERMGLSSSDGRLDAEEVYAGFWWKPSSPFDVGPNGNKIAFLFNGGGDAGGQQFLILYPDGRLHVLPEYRGDFQWRRPNVNATACHARSVAPDRMVRQSARHAQMVARRRLAGRATATSGIRSISTCFSSARRGAATAAPGSARPIATGSTTCI